MTRTAVSGLSATLATLFPPQAAVAELIGRGDPAQLFDEESACLGAAVLTRRQEFAAGRLCARLALRQFGIEGFALRAATDRQPIWPAQFVGSITHTEGFCAAVVAERKVCTAVGIDSEVVDHVGQYLWKKICHPTELATIRALSPAEGARAAALVFCAKEAFYKCQYPLAGEPLNFADVTIEARWGEDAGLFSVVPARPLAVQPHTGSTFAGRFLYHQRFVTAALAFQ